MYRMVIGGCGASMADARVIETRWPGLAVAEMRSLGAITGARGDYPGGCGECAAFASYVALAAP